MIRYASLGMAAIITGILVAETLHYGAGSFGFVTTMGSMTSLVLVGLIRVREGSEEAGVHVSVKDVAVFPPEADRRYGVTRFDGVRLANLSFRKPKYLEFQLRVHRPGGAVETRPGTFAAVEPSAPAACALGGPLVLEPWWRSPRGRNGALCFVAPEPAERATDALVSRREILVVDLISGHTSRFPLDSRVRRAEPSPALARTS